MKKDVEERAKIVNKVGAFAATLKERNKMVLAKVAVEKTQKLMNEAGNRARLNENATAAAVDRQKIVQVLTEDDLNAAWRTMIAVSDTTTCSRCKEMATMANTAPQTTTPLCKPCKAVDVQLKAFVQDQFKLYKQSFKLKEYIQTFVQYVGNRCDAGC